MGNNCPAAQHWSSNWWQAGEALNLVQEAKSVKHVKTCFLTFLAFIFFLSLSILIFN